MDPISFYAAFLLEREPAPQPKLTENQIMTTCTTTEPAQIPAPNPPEPERKPEPYPEPEHPRGPIAPPEPEPDMPQEKTKPKEPETPQINQPVTSNRPIYLPPKTTPISWKLADRFGVTWTFPDKLYLERFVAARNATVLVPQSYVPTGSCSSGHCAR